MYLCIDLSRKQQIHLILFDLLTVHEHSAEAENRELLVAVSSFLASKGVPPHELRGMLIVTPAASFTSTRLAGVVANVFGYAHPMPLLAVPVEALGDLRAYIPKLLEQPLGQYVHSVYSGEPNIGRKK